MISPLYMEFSEIDYLRPSFLQSLLFMFFNPLFWNLVGRAEYRNRSLSRIVGGNRRVACYLLAASILSLGILRDYMFTRAIKDQVGSAWLEQGLVLGTILPLASILFGQILVLSSFWRLGIIGTFLGDHFGFLMDAPVTAFPYNLCEHPMYQGATLIFLGYSLWERSMAGLVLTVATATAYTIASKFEGEFTKKIYARTKPKHS